MKEPSRSKKLVLKKIAVEDGETVCSNLYGEHKAISEAYQSSNSLSNALRELAKAEYLERERDGKTFKYWLSEKGKKYVRMTSKRERERKKKNDDIFEYEQGVEEFVKFYEETEYGKKEVNNVGMGRNYVYLDYQKLEKFNVDLADDLMTDPDNVLDACEEAINSIPEVKESVSVRVENVSDIETQSIRDLSARDINKLITVEGVIQSVSKPGSILVSGIFECTQCGERYKKDQRKNKKLKSPYKCGSCGARKFDTIQEVHETVRYLRIKEKPNKKSRNKIVAILQGAVAEDEGKNVNEIGSGVRVTGYLEARKEKKNSESYNFRLNVNNLEIEETKWEIEDISEGDKEKIHEISKRDDTVEYLSKSLAYEDIKNARLLKKTFMVWLNGRTGDFGNLHVLCIGDPGTAKSHLADHVQENFGKVIKAVATGATEVGLTASVTKDEVTGEFTAEGGSIPMADGGFHITDEIDELDKKHYSAFNEALSDETIHISKANIVTDISADVAEFSLGNPTSYSFDPHQEKYKQIPIDKDDLISRYGLIMAIESNDASDESSVIDERDKVNHVLNRNDSKSFEDDDYVRPELLSKYVYYSQRIYPVLTEDARDLIEKNYMKLFESQDKGESFLKIRHVNALAIISKAFARMNLQDEVTSNHVKKAFDLFQECYASMDFNIGSDDLHNLEGLNKNRLQAVKSKISNQEMRDIEDVISEVDLPDDQAEEIISKLKSDGEAFEPQKGFIKKL